MLSKFVPQYKNYKNLSKYISSKNFSTYDLVQREQTAIYEDQQTVIERENREREEEIERLIREGKSIKELTSQVYPFPQKHDYIKAIDEVAKRVRTPRTKEIEDLVQQSRDNHPRPEDIFDSNGRPNFNKIAHLDYKVYPRLPHQDPNSPEYIESERDEYHDSIEVIAYNNVIDVIKNDIKCQEEIYQIIENMDRPYLRGTPGIHRNAYDKIKDYSGSHNIEGRMFPGDEEIYNTDYNNVIRFTNNSPFYEKHFTPSNIIEHQFDWLERPVTKNYHGDKGYKYDVKIPDQEKFPHIADRMGYPEILGHPIDRLLRLEADIFHPTNLDQPFVKVPNPHPSASLNFEEGEIVYENYQIREWAKMWTYSGLSVFGIFGLVMPYQLVFKTHFFTSAAMETIFIPHHHFSAFYWDYFKLHIPISVGVITYGAYTALALANKFFRDYVVKVQYNKDKDLVFVTTINHHGGLNEECFESQHLEILPPSVKIGTRHLSSQDDDGLWDVSCLRTQRTFTMYNNQRYWNPHERKNFFKNASNFWSDDLYGATNTESVIQKTERDESIQVGEQKETRYIEASH